MNRKINLLVALLFCFMAVGAQCSKLSFDGAWMFSSTKICKDRIHNEVNALIDTGCSVCLVDSTFAADSCGVFVKQLNTIDKVKEIEEVRVIILDSLIFCDKVFYNVQCCVMDLKKRFKQHSPDFIIGANILLNRIWKFDIQNSKICLINKYNDKGLILKLKKWTNYKNIGTGLMVLEGKIGNNKTLFVFDTGARKSIIERNLYTGNGVTIQKESADIYNSLQLKNEILYKNVAFSINGISFTNDFINGESTDDFGWINTDFFEGKSFILDYVNNKIVIID